VSLATAAALIYPAVNGWWSAWHWYHTWADSTSLVAAEKAVLPQVKGEIYGSKVDSSAYYASGYYLGLNLAENPLADGLPPVTILNSGGVGAVVLFFPASGSSGGQVSNEISMSGSSTSARQALVSYLDSSSDNGRQLAAITVALDNNANFRLTRVGPYDSSSADSVYAIWVRT
jgi:hypothetical protein